MEDYLKTLIDQVAQETWWVSPDVYKKIKVVYPKARRCDRKNGEEREDIVKGVRLWYNEPAQEAFWRALSRTTKKINGFWICHIYERSSYDPKHFTNLAGIYGAPEDLFKKISEWNQIEDVLKYHSYKLYGYKGPENKVPAHPEYYPKTWQHVDKLDKSNTEIIVNELKWQSINRPTRNRKDN